MRHFRYRLGLDLGSTSIGWCLLRLDQSNPPQPRQIIKMGVRIFSDGRNHKDGSSLAVTRRLARQMRRRRDRLLKRKARMINALIRLGFFPKEESQQKALEALDPYSLRKKGLDHALQPGEFARALFHINQRRGFKSNRKTDKGDSDSGKLKTAIKRVHEQMAIANVRTVGEWLANRIENKLGVRARKQGSGKEETYSLYIDRGMIEAEFDALWANQMRLDPVRFNEAARIELKDILLFQRPLRPVKPGRCTLIPTDERAPIALPSMQRFRIYQEANNLAILDERLEARPLTLAERNIVVSMLENQKTVTFTAIRKKLKLPSTALFNLEDVKRTELKGNATGTLLAKGDFFGDAWHEFSEAQQDEIVEQLINEQGEGALIDWLMKTSNIDEPHAEHIANVSLPAGYGNLGRNAVLRVLPQLVAAVVPYSKAVELAGLGSHSALSHAEQTGEIMSELPYYGEPLQRHVGFGSGIPGDSAERRYGRIANPTVHIGLNQLRKVVNTLIGKYGNPAEVVVEVARDLKMSRERRLELQKEQTERQNQNSRWRAEIREATGIDAKPIDLQRMRLWVELNPKDVSNRRCPYTGEQIGLSMLFSDAVEVEHILPFSKTLDDSLNNKTVCLQRANRDKGNRTPFEAFGHSPPGYNYQDILERSKSMTREKQKRFAQDGYERWLREDKDFLARALNDTAYLSRVAKEYISLICPPNKVRAIPGRLTAMLRGKYGLNHLLSGSELKNRNDHRHHAIDAAIVAITDQGLLQRFANANADAREQRLHRLVEEMPDPWPRFREDVALAVQQIWVSHKPDHGFEGVFHDATAFGLREDGFVVHRVPLTKFASDKDVEKAKFASPPLGEWLLANTRGLTGKEFAAKVQEITKDFRHRRVKVIEKLHVLKFTSDRDGSKYKGYLGNSNYCIEIIRNEKGKWEGEVISTFQAYQIAAMHGIDRLRNKALAQSEKPLVMRLCINDAVRLHIDDQIRTLRIVTIKANGQILFADHNEANVDARNRDKANDFSYISKMAGSLQAAKGRRISISPIGVVIDPGFSG